MALQLFASSAWDDWMPLEFTLRDFGDRFRFFIIEEEYVGVFITCFSLLESMGIFLFAFLRSSFSFFMVQGEFPWFLLDQLSGLLDAIEITFRDFRGRFRLCIVEEVSLWCLCFFASSALDNWVPLAFLLWIFQESLDC